MKFFIENGIGTIRFVKDFPNRTQRDLFAIDDDLYDNFISGEGGIEDRYDVCTDFYGENDESGYCVTYPEDISQEKVEEIFKDFVKFIEENI